MARNIYAVEGSLGLQPPKERKKSKRFFLQGWSVVLWFLPSLKVSLSDFRKVPLHKLRIQFCDCVKATRGGSECQFSHFMFTPIGRLNYFCRTIITLWTIEISTGSTIIKNYCHYLRSTWFTPPGTLNSWISSQHFSSMPSQSNSLFRFYSLDYRSKDGTPVRILLVANAYTTFWSKTWKQKTPLDAHMWCTH